LASFKDFIDDKLDHRHVDNVIDGPCMAENLARYLYELASGVWPEVVAARVGESPKIWVEYWPAHDGKTAPVQPDEACPQRYHYHNRVKPHRQKR
jgi:hypothetical protein